MRFAPTSALPAICGRVCPQENQCESKCVRGHQGRTAWASAGWSASWPTTPWSHGAQETDLIPEQRRKGGRDRLRPRGPDLRRGSGASWAMPSRCSRRCIRPAACWCTAFRNSVCPRTWCGRKSPTVEKMGVEIRHRYRGRGRTVSLDELFEAEGFEAVFIGSGAGLPRFQGIPGREPERRLFRQRIPDPHQPDEGL